MTTEIHEEQYVGMDGLAHKRWVLVVRAHDEDNHWVSTVMPDDFGDRFMQPLLSKLRAAVSHSPR